jgi:hypothetical protein
MAMERLEWEEFEASLARRRSNAAMMVVGGEDANRIPMMMDHCHCHMSQ